MDFNSTPVRITIVAVFLLACFLAGIVVMGHQQAPPPWNDAAANPSAGERDAIPTPAAGSLTRDPALPGGIFILPLPVKIELVAITPGTFFMGSPDGEKSRDPDETQHEVTLTHPYYIGKTEVTQLQWKKVMGDNPSAASGDDLPVENVSFTQVEQYCRLLSLQSGKNFRLPTEAEWEYACRAGTSDPFQGKTLDQVAWANHPAASEPHPVATKAPNAWGIYDMLGNVWELCSDYYADYSPGPATDPLGPAGGTNHVNRGGAFQDDSTMGAAANGIPWRSANRGSASPGPSPKRGFRLVMDVP